MRRITLLIATVMAALTTNAAITDDDEMLERLATVVYLTVRLTDSELEWLGNSHVVRNGATWADSVRAHNGEVSFAFLSDFLEDVKQAFEKRKKQHTDGYRMTLMVKMAAHDLFYEYEEKDRTVEEFRENIDRFINTPDEHRGWIMLADLAQTEYYTPRSLWRGHVLSSRIDRFLESNPAISARLRILLMASLMAAVENSTYSCPPKIVQNLIADMKKTIIQEWPDYGDWILHFYESSFLMSKIVSDPDAAFPEVIQLSHIVDEGWLTNMELFSASSTLSNYYNYKNDIAESQRYIDKTRQATERMASEYGRVNAASNALIYQKLILDTDDQSGHDREIYDELKVQFGDSKYARRCIGNALSDFVEFRTGQTSELPSLQAARDYLALIKEDPYDRYRFGAMLSAGMKIAMGGQVSEGRAIIDELVPSTPYETFLMSFVTMDWEANFNTRPEILYEAAIKAYETNRTTGINSAEDDNVIINYLAQSATNLEDTRYLEKIKPLLAELCVRLECQPWDIYAHWDIAIAEANMQNNISKRINTLKSLLARAENMKINEKAISIAYQLSMVYMMNNNVKEAEAALEKALAYSSLEGLDFWLYDQYLSFLHNIKSDHAKWRKMLSSVVADAEQFHLDLQFPFLRLIVNQLNITLTDNNMEDAWVMMGLFNDKGGKIVRICQDDPFARQQLMNTILPMFVQLTSFINNNIQNVVGNDTKLTNSVLDNLKEVSSCIYENIQIIENGEYNNVYQTFDNRMALCWITLALDGEKKAAEYFERTKEWVQEVGIEDISARAFSEFELELAWRNNDYERIEQIIDTPSFWSKVQNRSVSVRALASYLSALVTAKFAQRDYEGAQKIAEKRQEIVREHIDSQFLDLSESQRDALFLNGTASTLLLNTALRFNPTTKASINAYNATLYYRNLLLSSNQSLRRAVYTSGDSTQIADYERMLEYRTLAAKASTTSTLSQEESLEIFRNKRIARELEDSVYTRAASAGLLESRRSYKYSDVAKALADDEAAIEFIADTDNYGALIARKGFKAPVYVPLLSADELRGLLEHTNNASLKTGLQKLYAWRSDGKKTYRGIWEPIEPYLSGIKVIYYTPENDLNQISFAAIEDSTRTALCEKYDLRLVSSTANLAARAEARKKDKRDSRPKLSCLAIGGVPYDLDATRDPGRKGAWHSLPNAASEVERFDSICSAAGFVSILYTGGDTREDDFRTLSGLSPDILLLATHGYYLSPEQASKMPYFIGKGLTKDNNPNYAIPPMDRGGLILADANPVWINECTRPNDTDGVLTASEIATLNLSNTKLLILSACETALGSNSILCGVNGLQRGFKLAGVNSIIMSLWEVNDVAGEKFMNEFYSQFFLTLNRYEAFQNARLKLKELYPRDPSLWAPFIMLD